MGGRAVLRVAAAVLLAGPAWTADVQAQIPEFYENLQVLPDDITRREMLDVMRGFALDLGVRCEYCHVGEDPSDFSTFDFGSDRKMPKVKARRMLEMVRDINANHIEGLRGRSDKGIEVGCRTCHAGKAFPTTLEQEVTWAFEEGGVDQVRARYEELRQEYFGRGAFDFGAMSLENVAQSMGREDPEGALGIVTLNLEYNEESTASWTLKGQLHQILGQNEEAIAALERALSIQPENPVAERLLRQLRGGL